MKTTNSGFTLIEIIIYYALGAFLLSLIFTSFIDMLDSSRKTETLIISTHELFITDISK